MPKAREFPTPRAEADKLSHALGALKLKLDQVKTFDLENYVNVKLSRATILDRGELLGSIEDLSSELTQILELRELPGSRKPKGE